MLFPLRDINPTETFPKATIGLIAITVGCWVFIQGTGSHPYLSQSVCAFGLVPASLTGSSKDLSMLMNSMCHPRDWNPNLGLITTMFMHGGWLHIIGNMWSLWIFGDNLEDELGPTKFLFFYFLCGIFATLFQIISDPDSILPVVGASGAISGIMGAYILLYPKSEIRTLLFVGFFMILQLPARVVIASWFILQLLFGVLSLDSQSGGVAYWAHIGGFLTGIVSINLFGRRKSVEDKS